MSALSRRFYPIKRLQLHIFQRRNPRIPSSTEKRRNDECCGVVRVPAGVGKRVVIAEGAPLSGFLSARVAGDRRCLTGRPPVGDCLQDRLDDVGTGGPCGPCGSRVSSTATAGTRTLCATNAMVPSVPELRFLFAKLLFRPPVTKSFVMQWTLWRRRHRAGTSWAHYKRRKKCNFSISNVTFRILYYGFFVSGKSPFQIAHVRSCGCGNRQRPRLSCESSKPSNHVNAYAQRVAVNRKDLAGTRVPGIPGS